VGRSGKKGEERESQKRVGIMENKSNSTANGKPERMS
jgi:hypothetical protein